jgi:predicted ArsR family transcriptional regulator
MTTAGIRRHLDLLEAAGLVTTLQTAPRVRRGRGRPAREFVLTDAGHAAMASGYDTIAVQALEYLAETAGADAVRGFARRRAGELGERHRDSVEAAGSDTAARARALARGLTQEGYAAGTRPVGTLGVQLCQGHCPVQDVARSFPELCEAEAEMFSELIGVHVQRLATLAHGEHVCTTYIPTDRPPDRSTSGSSTRSSMVSQSGHVSTDERQET